MGLPYWKPRTDTEPKSDSRLSSDLSSRRRTFDQRFETWRTIRPSSSSLSSAPTAPLGRVPPHPSTQLHGHRRTRAVTYALRRSDLLSRRTRPHTPARRSNHNDDTLFSVPSPSPSASPPLEDLDRLVQQRFDEKEDLLCQLEFTASLLDQFLSARSALGSDSSVGLPSFIADELPNVLSTAASLTSETYRHSLSSSSQSRSSTSSPDYSTMTEAELTQEFADQLIHLPPYSTRLRMLESDIQSVQRRIMDQLGLLGTTAANISRGPRSGAQSPLPSSSRMLPLAPSELVEDNDHRRNR
ncbi:hypothetical protein BX666DRAFT_1105986 [Dichotomocladium elegans]|nr:hypothetical protein BX666DRAFT_1105986 [Dichotomocladium elegans]